MNDITIGLIIAILSSGLLTSVVVHILSLRKDDVAMGKTKAETNDILVTASRTAIEIMKDALTSC